MVGRIQLRYTQGLWNEWYLLFDDGSGAWLGDSSGLFTLTTVREMAQPLPGFHEIVPGQPTQIGTEHYIASEKREAECIAMKANCRSGSGTAGRSGWPTSATAPHS
ncbi:DUF4178 domain-containing protein [Massilia sp. H-1]|nr:DUF4178 domain-containing protein [Massilia sp. H-1]